MKELSFFFLLLASLNLGGGTSAGMNQTFHWGEKEAEVLLKDARDMDKKPENIVPNFSTAPHESKLKATDLSSKAYLEAKKQDASLMIQENNNNRERFQIDPIHDPLIRDAAEIEANALKAIGGKDTKIKTVENITKPTQITCEESGDPYELQCHEQLTVKLKEELGPIQQGSFNMKGKYLRKYHKTFLNGWKRRGNSNHILWIRQGESQIKQFVADQTGIPQDQIGTVTLTNSQDEVQVSNKCYTYKTFTFSYTFQEKIKREYDTWTHNCETMEEKVDQGLCEYNERICTKGPETRNIDNTPVTRDCWEYKKTYSCEYPAKNDCIPLRAQGCTQISSSCKEKIGKSCVIYNQTYECLPQTESHSGEMIIGGQIPYCLDGNCASQSWKKNNEMTSSLAQLSLFKEMQGQVKLGSIFKGSSESCKRQILGFRDCCSKGKGWGTDLSLASCSAQEKVLNQKRKQHLCHYVGTYCAEKVLGTCITKKSTYCCFGSKLLKTFHEQGRPQIKLGWGDAENPICRGFSVEELQKIDFSKLDLRSVYDDLMKKYKAPQTKLMEKQLHDRMNSIQESLKNGFQKFSPQQREGA